MTSVVPTSRPPTPAARELLRRALSETPVRCRDDGTVELQASQKELADQLGLAASTVNQHIGRLRAAGWLSPAPRLDVPAAVAHELAGQATTVSGAPDEPGARTGPPSALSAVSDAALVAELLRRHRHDPDVVGAAAAFLDAIGAAPAARDSAERAAGAAGDAVSAVVSRRDEDETGLQNPVLSRSEVDPRDAPDSSRAVAGRFGTVDDEPFQDLITKVAAAAGEAGVSGRYTDGTFARIAARVGRDGLERGVDRVLSQLPPDGKVASPFGVLAQALTVPHRRAEYFGAPPERAVDSDVAGPGAELRWVELVDDDGTVRVSPVVD